MATKEEKPSNARTAAQVKADDALLAELGLTPKKKGPKAGSSNARGEVHMALIADGVKGAGNKPVLIVPMVSDGKDGWTNAPIPAAAKKAAVVVQSELARDQLRTYVKRFVAEHTQYRVVNFDPGFLLRK